MMETNEMKVPRKIVDKNKNSKIYKATVRPIMTYVLETRAES